jgi:small GTP-binding protein
MAMKVNNEASAKVVMLGDSLVGKTCLTIRLCDGRFSENEMVTIGAAYKQTVVSGRTLDIWDTAGQERYAAIAPLYYRGAQAAVVVYDVNNRKSYEKAAEWLKKLRGEVQVEDDVVIALASNKVDLPHNRRQVTEAEAIAFASTKNLLHYNTSAKTGEGVDALFEDIVKRLPSKSRENRDVKLGGLKNKKIGNRSCCN